VDAPCVTLRQMKALTMRSLQCALLLATLVSAGCGTQHAAPGEAQALTPERAAAVDSGVRAFMRDVAHDVTQDGPAAWRKYFADTPAFFMAVNGKIAFANSAEVTAGLPQVALVIKQIELKWGDDLRVDPLAPDLAVVAASYHEVQVWADGHHVEDSGYFTGVAQYRDSRWQFRNAHWSEPVASPPAH
jgi:hypothetical protein